METKIKKRFSLYDSEKHKSKMNATFFDLLSGKWEPQQTKGLAAVFYWNHKFLFDFLNLDAIREKTGKKFSEKNVAALEVCAERTAVDRKRADIVITLDGKEGPPLAVIIEAKSIGTGGVNTKVLSQKIKSAYLKESQFPELRNYKKVGVVLTKYTQYISDIACVTWDQIIELLGKPSNPKSGPDIISQYRDFLTNIGGAMKFYEEEVLSLPAGRTSALIQKHQVYSCEAESKNANCRTPLYMAFREKDGGAMSTLYKLEDKIQLDPKALEQLENSDTAPGHIKRIKGYIDALFSREPDPFPNGDHLFYVFSTDNNIDLPKKPRPFKSNTSPVYYTLKQMLEEEILKPRNAVRPLEAKKTGAHRERGRNEP